MLDVTFLGDLITVKENPESNYAVENGVSLEEAIATVNIGEVYDEENVEASLTYLLGRVPTQEEIDACEWVQVPIEPILGGSAATLQEAKDYTDTEIQDLNDDLAALIDLKANIAYVAGTPSDWATSAPASLTIAINRLASLVKTLNSGTAIP
jgi:hypothetical protein